MKRYLKSLPFLVLMVLAMSLPARRAPAQTTGVYPCQFIQFSAAAIGTSAAVFPNNSPGQHGTPATGLYSTNSLGQLTNRKFITFCVSKDTGQPAGALVRIRLDGTNPANAIADASQVLGIGDCISYPVPASVQPKLISTSATTYVHAFECL